MHLLRGHVQGLDHRLADPPAELLPVAEAAGLDHPLLRRLAVLHVRRLVARRARPAQHDQIRPLQFLAQLLAHVVPEIGVEGALALHRLRRAGEVHRDRLQLPVAVPEEKGLHAAVLRTLEAAKLRRIGFPVHLRAPVAVDRAAVVPDRGVTERPTDAGAGAGLPGARRHVDEPRQQEIDILRRLHDAGRRQVVFVTALTELHRHRRGVGVRRGQEHPPQIDLRQAGAQALAKRLLHAVADRHQVARDDDGVIRGGAGRARFERERRSDDGRVGPWRHARGEVARQRHRAPGRDVGFGRADEELGGACAGGDARQHRRAQQQDGGLFPDAGRKGGDFHRSKRPPRRGRPHGRRRSLSDRTSWRVVTSSADAARSGGKRSRRPRTGTGSGRSTARLSCLP